MAKNINIVISVVKLGLILLLLSSHANADETFHLPSNENTVITAISKAEITRISFATEIENVHSLKGELEYEIVGRDLYLRAFVDKPINFFVKTFSGRTYKLITTPENIPATQVFIRNLTVKQKPKCIKTTQNKETQK